jgi:hypothetical protein
MRARARGGLGERVDEETTKTKNGERRSARVETLRHDSTRKSALERVSMLYKYHTKVSLSLPQVKVLEGSFVAPEADE